MDPITLALLTAGISAGGSALGGLFGRQKASGYDKQKRQLIDELLSSVKGEGRFSDMFNADEGAFQKSYVEPAKQLFRDQIAPQIQQQYIYQGQQRGSGIEDTLSRAGVDLDQLLNQQYANFQNQGYDRLQNAIGTILGNPTRQSQSLGSAAGQGAAGYLAGDNFGSDITRILNSFKKDTSVKQNMDFDQRQPQGFTPNP